ncbi:hypothetical protein QE152_g18133 [Popillia japonica]|uniref:Reverse transcriptase domain-containing protein n=1 Tax=Popillia japonica TaxID=7064 RepID=A0AAW1L5K9_POPJA
MEVTYTDNEANTAEICKQLLIEVRNLRKEQSELKQSLEMNNEEIKAVRDDIKILNTKWEKKLATEANMIISSTMFPHPKRHKVTWIAPDNKTQTQIDHVLVTRRRQSSIQDVRTYRGACVDSDHYMVTATVKQKVKNKIKTRKKQHNWNIEIQGQDKNTCHTTEKKIEVHGIAETLVNFGTKTEDICPARNVKCHTCEKPGHFAKVCMGSSKPKGKGNKSKAVNAKPGHFAKVCMGSSKPKGKVVAAVVPHLDCMSDSSSSSSTTFRLHVYRSQEIPAVEVKVNNIKTSFIIDTGSSINLVNMDTFRKLSNVKLIKETASVFPYNTSKKLPIIGKFKAEFQHSDNITAAEVYVVKGNGESLLSYNTSKELKLVHISFNNRQHIDMKYVQNNYPRLFKGVGNLTDHEVNLHVDEQVKPITQTDRRIPFSIRNKIKDQIKRLKEADIIEEATGPTTWVSPIVIVPRAHRPDSIRLCVDMRAANQAIKREMYVSPTVDDILSQLNGSKLFSKIDLKEGYHQLTLSKVSRKVTTFATHIGLFQCKRLNFGINSAVEIFQRTIRQVLADIPNVINISDDILTHFW